MNSLNLSSIPDVIRAELGSVFQRFDHVDTKISNVAKSVDRLESLVLSQQKVFFDFRDNVIASREHLWSAIKDQEKKQAQMNGETQGGASEIARERLNTYYYWIKIGSAFAVLTFLIWLISLFSSNISWK